MKETIDYSLFDNIPNDEVMADLAETEAEAKQFEAELHVLRQNPVENRLQIYMKEGHLGERHTFIEKLKGILEYRETK